MVSRIIARFAAVSAVERGAPFFYGWIVLAVATLGICMTGPGQTYGVSIFIEPMVQELEWSRSTISGAYSIATTIAGLSMIAFGAYLDRRSARVVVAVVAGLFGATCVGMATVSTPLAALLGFTGLRVLGQAALSLSCTTLAARWFIRRRGRAMSIVMLGAAASNALFPLILQGSISSYGWRTTWIYCGIAVWVVLVVPAALLIRDRPEAIGQAPDGARADPPTRGRAAAPTVEHTWTLGQAMRSSTFWLLIAGTMAPGAISTGLIFHQVSYFASRGLSAEVAASALTAFAIAFAATTFVVGFVLERVPERYVLAGGLLLLPVGVLCLMAATTPPVALLYGALLGVVSGTNGTTSASIWAGYYGRRHLGSIRGLTQAINITAAATGPLMLSIPYDLFGSYTAGLWFMAALPVAGALAAVLAGPPAPPPARGARR
ncbi:MAG: MFS transporter [Chloroflexota bacterium]|nr:MFS transporter [Chloroflexota bacterium]